MTPLLLLAAAFGLAIGSFLTVVAYRVPRGESLVRPGSHCPQCAAPVKPWHNVPVLSWVLLRGRCAHCGHPIGVRYPLTEAVTAALFVAVTARFGASAVLPAYLYLAAVAVALALIDLDVRRLPNAIVLPSYPVVAVLLTGAAVWHKDWHAVERALIGLGALWTFYFALAFVYPGGMGYGDVKLAGLLGLYLGWLGWSTVLVGALGGFLLGGVVGALLMLLKRATRKTALPFGPYMLAGALFAVFFGGPVGSWYAHMFIPT